MPTNGTYQLRTGSRRVAPERMYPSVRVKRDFRPARRLPLPEPLRAPSIPQLPDGRRKTLPNILPSIPSTPIGAPDAAVMVFAESSHVQAPLSVGHAAFIVGLALAMTVLISSVAAGKAPLRSSAQA